MENRFQPAAGGRRQAAGLLDPGFADCPVPGVDLLVAYLPWYGWNMEDAIVASRRLVDENILDWRREEICRVYVKPGMKPCCPALPPAGITSLSLALGYGRQCGRRRPGWINPGEPLAFFKDLTGRTRLVNYEGVTPGELLEIFYAEPQSEFLGGVLTWKIGFNRPLAVGDKLMGRYGNKGVVSRILPLAEMPSLPDDPRLPTEFRGRSVDILLNPHGVISRMNLGQLLETQAGFLMRLLPEQRLFADGFGRAFAEVDPERLTALFRKLPAFGGETGFDEFGRIRLQLPGDGLTAAPVTVGFQYIVRLKQVAADKAQVRGGVDSRQKGRCAYNLITGQPAGGRRLRGGQRLGEMEIWSLAANRAHHFIENVLTVKSDAGCPDHSPAGNSWQGQTFRAVLDHFAALGIRFRERDDGKAILAFMLPESPALDKVTSNSTWDLGVMGAFVCPHENCDYRLPIEICATGRSQRNPTFKATVRDVLRSCGWSLDRQKADRFLEIFPASRKREVNEGEINLPLYGPASGKRRRLKLHYKCKKRSLSLEFHLERKPFVAYTQVDASDNGKIVVEVKKIMEAGLVCAKKHRTNSLVRADGGREVYVPSPGGMCDPDIFGNLDVGNWCPGRGGYLLLPDVPFRKCADNNTGRHSSFLLEYLGRQAKNFSTCCLPVLPLKYRYQPPGANFAGRGKDLTGLYANLFKQADSRGHALSARQPDQNIVLATAEKIKNQVLELEQIITGRLFGKYGLLRRHALGRRVDFSARLVIVPDPDLDWDACGVPASILAPLLGPRLVASGFLDDFHETNALADSLLREMMAGSCPDAEAAAAMADEVLKRDFWFQPFNGRKNFGAAMWLVRDVLDAYLRENPDIVVLLNRQPSLHRYSMMGFRPRVLSPEEGLVLKINPLVCKGFGADFDGDEMTVHLPLDEEDTAEVRALSPVQAGNLISVADGQILANFDQDFVCGHFYISLDPGRRRKLRNLFPVDVCPDCAGYFDVTRWAPPWQKVHGEKLLEHLCRKHQGCIDKIVPQWMRQAFTAITEEGLSFGFLELVGVQGQFQDGSLARNGDFVDPKELTAQTGEKVLEKLDKLVKSRLSADPGFGFAALAVSGARGRKQARQLVGSRGLLAPGDIAFDAGTDFFIKCSLVEGMHPDEAFHASMNVRSSMVDKKLGTGLAGYLTRRLVLILWEWLVLPGDCGADGGRRRSLENCVWRHEKRICSACYNDDFLKGMETFAGGWLAGLLAAQSFGERGTQLSMQSFHTAERQLSLDGIVSLLGGRDSDFNGKNWFAEENADGFVKRIREISAYQKIRENHLRLIWLAIHLSARQTLDGAWKEFHSPLGGLVGKRQKDALWKALEGGDMEDFITPLVKVMTGLYPGTGIMGKDAGHGS